ncbi:hypothetical protein [Glycomyces xiaoerkulensis]|uniref:hypothetical protein n=1 Tax=Glycomyces xiaoerkulensis TaxID=2038139 RepID=UPI0012FFF5CA|nr:hypothetical protein [Glycomyces xiaoerkulensis]
MGEQDSGEPIAGIDPVRPFGLVVAEVVPALPQASHPKEFDRVAAPGLDGVGVGSVVAVNDELKELAGADHTEAVFGLVDIVHCGATNSLAIRLASRRRKTINVSNTKRRCHCRLYDRHGEDQDTA